ARTASRSSGLMNGRWQYLMMFPCPKCVSAVNQTCMGDSAKRPRQMPHDERGSRHDSEKRSSRKGAQNSQKRRILKPETALASIALHFVRFVPLCGYSLLS